VRLPFGETDAEDLAGGDVHVGGQEVPPDRGVGEGAFAPFGLPDHRHLAGVPAKLLAVPLQSRRGIRQVELIGPRDRLVEDGDGLLADPLALPHYATRVRHMMSG
jgi:hypothetical protein